MNLLNDDGASLLKPAVFVLNATPKLEGNSGLSPMTFAIQLSAASKNVITVGWFTSNNEAVAGSDYVAASGTVTFQPGQLLAIVTVQIIGDKILEPDERFNLSLHNPINADIGDGHATGNIQNDD